MQTVWDSAWPAVMSWLALPQHSLWTVLVMSFLSATLLPLGSEPVVLGVVNLQPHLLWPVVGVATLGNTLGGALNWALGYGAHGALDRWQGRWEQRAHQRALGWLQRLGPRACLLAWLPVVGDPLCAVAGWLRLPFWPCVAYMAVGKLARYAVLTALFLGVFPGFRWPGAG